MHIELNPLVKADLLRVLNHFETNSNLSRVIETLRFFYTFYTNQFLINSYKVYILLLIQQLKKVEHDMYGPRFLNF